MYWLTKFIQEVVILENYGTQTRNVQRHSIQRFAQQSLNISRFCVTSIYVGMAFDMWNDTALLASGIYVSQYYLAISTFARVLNEIPCFCSFGTHLCAEI